MSKYKEIIIDYVDPEGILYVDAYRTGDADDDGDGRTIAWVLPSGTVLYKDDSAQYDDFVQPYIAEAIKIQRTAETEQ